MVLSRVQFCLALIASLFWLCSPLPAINALPLLTITYHQKMRLPISVSLLLWLGRMVTSDLPDGVFIHESELSLTASKNPYSSLSPSCQSTTEILANLEMEKQPDPELVSTSSSLIMIDSASSDELSSSHDIKTSDSNLELSTIRETVEYYSAPEQEFSTDDPNDTLLDPSSDDDPSTNTEILQSSSQHLPVETLVATPSSISTPFALNSMVPEPFDNSSGISELSDEFEEAKAQFLSFEDWKRLKGVDFNPNKESEKSIKRSQNNNEKKKQLHEGAIGEEMEIDLSNFFQTSNTNDQEPEGKIYKDKFNFASFDCGATIVKTNSEAKSATSILFENKDSYLLNPCSATNKFVTIELCQDILVDSVVLGNFEFFSSTFKKVQISVSDIFPVPKNGWKILGTYTAKDVRDFQTFTVDNPMIWAKYFRIEILEYYGNEYYCPLSVVRVHGRTMMQEYKQEEAQKVSGESHPEPTQESIYVESDKESDCKYSRTSQKTAEINSSNQTVYGTILGSVHSVNISGSPIFDDTECAVVLPLLRFEEFFKDFNNKSECEPANISTTSITSTPQPNIGTQESIYKNIMKRLSSLEANATLSVLYIEEQSKLLASAFTSLEKKHSLRMDNIIRSVNTTVNEQIQGLTELFRTFHLQTESIFYNQQKSHEELLKDAYYKIDLLSSELKFQKIIGCMNGLVLSGILIYVVLTRDATIDTEYGQSDNIWYNQQKQRIMSTGSKIKANITGLKIYTSYASDGSVKSVPSSDNDDGVTTSFAGRRDFTATPVTSSSNSDNEDHIKDERRLTSEYSD